MKIIIKIAKTELQKLFYSPVAWLILIIFAFQFSVLFIDRMALFVGYQDMRRVPRMLTWKLFSNSENTVLKGIFYKLLEYLYLYIPLLTMNIMSREISTGLSNYCILRR